MTPTAYPLSWPAGKPRTPWDRRVKSAFKTGKGGWSPDVITGSDRYKPAAPVQFTDALRRLQRELNLLRASLPVLSTNNKLRLDGVPMANQTVTDPGVAVYFQLRDRPVVLACDRYTTVASNMAAIAAHINAMRLAERHGVGSLDEMFRGFMTLPPALAMNDWRSELGDPSTLAQAEENFREKIRTEHPDVGGSEARAATLNEAIALARKNLT
jgi:hypothetical protein